MGTAQEQWHTEHTYRATPPVTFVFSDGHDTGIYSWDRLHRMQTVP